MAGDINKVLWYQDSLLNTLDAYYNEKAKYNQYDITVEGVIIDTSKKPSGIYTVKTDGAQFEAYAISGSYYKNDEVYV